MGIPERSGFPGGAGDDIDKFPGGDDRRISLEAMHDREDKGNRKEVKPLHWKAPTMSEPNNLRPSGSVKVARISNQVLASILTRLVKDAVRVAGHAKSKLHEALRAVAEFQTVMLDGLSITGRHGVGATEVFLTVWA